MAGDESALPWKGETPEGSGPGDSSIWERITGLQIARLHYLDNLGPTGSQGLALEFTNGARFIIFAGRDQNSGYSARLFVRFMRRPLIALPRMEKVWSGLVLGDDYGPTDELQRAVNGAVIHGVLGGRERTAKGGELRAIELTGGRNLTLWAEPALRMTDEGLMTADVGYAYSDRLRRHFE